MIQPERQETDAGRKCLWEAASQAAKETQASVMGDILGCGTGLGCHHLSQDSLQGDNFEALDILA